MITSDKIDTSNFGKIFIDSNWVNSSGNASGAVINPYTEKPIFDVISATEKDVDAAIASARYGFDQGPWPRMPATDRAKFVVELANCLRTRAESFAYAWTEQVGVLFSMSQVSPQYSIRTIERYVEAFRELPLIEQKPRATGAGFLVREPVGVVAAIAPWNAPLATMLNKIIPAMLAGCTVIMKPAPQTPAEAFIIAECAKEIGLPPGVLNLVPADREVSDYLVRSRNVDKVSFTGSLGAGRRIASVCGERIARVTLELGGKSAAIILDDYDLVSAANSLSSGICMLSGQNCAALTRVIISRRRHDEFVEELTKQMRGILIGDPYRKTTQLGPLAMKRQQNQVLSFIEKGKSEGAELILGGNKPSGIDTGFFVEPTIFANVDPSMTIAREEIFGPVISVLPSEDTDDSVRIANDSNFGLAGSVYTNDLDSAYRIARKIRSGTFAQNGPLADFSIGFGGFKESGLGREGGISGILSYLESKTLLLSGVPEQF